MALRKGFPVKLALAEPSDVGLDLQNLVVVDSSGVPRSGITWPTNALATGAAGMFTAVAAFDAVSVRDGRVVLLSNDGVVNVQHAAAPASGSRIDIIVAKQNDASGQVTTPDADNNPVIYAIAGQSHATSPVAPALPAGAVEVGRVTVPTGTTNMNTGTTYSTAGLQYTSPDGVVPFLTIAALRAWSGARPGQRARIVGDEGQWEFTAGAIWIPMFAVVGQYSWRANIGHQGTETPFSAITPTARDNSDPYASELFTIGPGGWTAKFDMWVRVSFAAYNAIGSGKQSLNGRSFWRFKLGGTPVQLLGYDSRYEVEVPVTSNIIRIPKNVQLSANAYQDTVGTTVTMVSDPTIEYLGPA